MKIAIHQPDFLPWLGFFNKVIHSDLFVIGDHVQFRNRGFQNRNRIKTAQGPKWLTVPIIHDWGQSINKIRILNREQNGYVWDDLHLLTLKINYAKAPFYDKYIGIYEKIFKKRMEYLAECNVEILKATFEILGIDKQIVMTSDWNLQQKKTDLVVEVCQKVGADTYISGLGGANYLDKQILVNNKIKLLYNIYEHPTYNQQFANLGFIPNMCILDLIFNHGPESLNIIKSGSRESEMDPISN